MVSLPPLLIGRGAPAALTLTADWPKMLPFEQPYLFLLIGGEICSSCGSASLCRLAEKSRKDSPLGQLGAERLGAILATPLHAGGSPPAPTRVGCKAGPQQPLAYSCEPAFYF